MKKFKFRWFNKAGNPIYKSFKMPDNTAMLIGLDRDGREVYEGDKILADDGKIGTATLEAQEIIGGFKLTEIAHEKI